MSEPGRAEQLHLLRNSIARIEAGGVLQDAERKQVPRQPPSDSQVAAEMPVRISVTAPVPRPASFYEIAPANAGDCSAAAGFALTIAGQMVKSRQRPVLWVAEDFALVEQGAPYAPGLTAYGIKTSDFTLIRTQSRLDLWRVMEEAIKSRAFAAVIGEPAALTGHDLPALIRRLTINARTHQSCAILLRPLAQSGFIAPSPLRFEVAATSPDYSAGSVLARPLPAPPVWSVRYRGAPGSAAYLDIPEFNREKPFQASLAQASLAQASLAQAHSAKTHVSRAKLLEEVTSMMIKERSGAALPVHLSHAA